MSARAILMCLVVSAACGSGAPGSHDRRGPSRTDAAKRRWPSLPESPSEAERLIARLTRRPPRKPAASLSSHELLAHPALSEGRQLVAGRTAVWSRLGQRLSKARAAGRSAYLLFGSFHDSGGQLAVFRRALGPAAVFGFSAVTIEQLDANGAWPGVPAVEQRGDDSLLARILHEGRPQDLAELQSRQERQDYTAWKFGFVDEVLDLVTAARALNLPLGGCDMPASLQQRLALSSPLRERLRELHCLLALETRLARKANEPRLVAMFWGQEHVRPHGLPRFLPARDLVLSIYLMGQRPGPRAEAELAQRLVVDDLLLLPLTPQADELALLLPGRPLGGDVSRSREWIDGPVAGPARLRVSSSLSGELFLAGRRLKVGPRETELELSPAPQAAYLLRTGRLRMVGSVELAAGSTVELSFDPSRRATTLHLSIPRGR